MYDNTFPTIWQGEALMVLATVEDQGVGLNKAWRVIEWYIQRAPLMGLIFRGPLSNTGGRRWSGYFYNTRIRNSSPGSARLKPHPLLVVLAAKQALGDSVE